MDDLALSIHDLHKQFRLPHERHSSLKALLMGRRDRGYDMQHVLRGVSFDVRKGEFFGVVGRNGSGKSTLLKLLAGIYQPTSGTVKQVGTLMPLIELGVGFNPELTGRANVYLNGAMVGLSRREVDEMYDDIVEFAGLEAFMDQRLKNYSSGMQVRLAFAIATRAKPDILLLDEVLAVGDADFQRKCMAYFADLKHSDTTVVLVSHDMNAVQEFCDRAVLVEGGEIVAEGSAEEVAIAYGHLFTPKNVEAEARPSTPHRAPDVWPEAHWGLGGVHFEDVEVASEFTEMDSEIVVSARLVPNPGLDRRLRLRFNVRNRDLRIVFGAGTSTPAQMRAFEVEPISPMRVTWRVPNVLNDGEYGVTLFADDIATWEVLEQWDFAATFTVRRQPRTDHVVALPISIEISPEVTA